MSRKWCYAEVQFNPARRTCLRFYSTNGDLFHEVEVPISRGHGPFPKKDPDSAPIDIHSPIVRKCPNWWSWKVFVWMDSWMFMLRHATPCVAPWVEPQEPSTAICTWPLQHHNFPCISLGRGIFWSSKCPGFSHLISGTRFVTLWRGDTWGPSWFCGYFFSQMTDPKYPKCLHDIPIASGHHTKVRDMLEYVPWKAEEHKGTPRTWKRVVCRETRVEAVQLLEEKRFDEAIRLANSVGHGIEGLGHIVCIKWLGGRMEDGWRGRSEF